MSITPRQLLPDLWLFQDICNVYVIKHDNTAIAIDFGSGAWLDCLPALGIEHIEHVFLTHHHADQCAGLQARSQWPFVIHAPVGEEKFLDAEQQSHGTFQILAKGCPDSYAALQGGLPNVQYDMAGFTDLFWGTLRVRFLHTPGHGRNACSAIVDMGSKQIAFCGDAAHDGGTIWQPYHLEWDHWTGAGALEAWQGVMRLHGIHVDMLCPAHGPVITKQPRALLAELRDKLLKLYHSKGQISSDEKDDYVPAELMTCGARKLSSHLYQYGTNGYLLRSDNAEALIVDPFLPDMPLLEALLHELGDVRLTACTATHYHFDHCDAIPYLRAAYGTRAYLHPLVAEPLRDVSRMVVPWLPMASIVADEEWPVRGSWTWNEYRFKVAPWPGQTRWHCVFMAEIDGQKVVMGGDSFQPASRWNGTGGYCAYNGSRFREGFIPSANLMLRWQPDILCTGHGTYYRFHASKFNKIIHWAESAEAAVKALCPTGQLQKDYYLPRDRSNAQEQIRGAYYWSNAG